MKTLLNLFADGVCIAVLMLCFLGVLQGAVLTYHFTLGDALCFCKGNECVKTVRYRYAIKYDPDAEHWTGRSKDYRSHWRSHKNIPPKPNHQN